MVAVEASPLTTVRAIGYHLTTWEESSARRFRRGKGWNRGVLGGKNRHPFGRESERGSCRSTVRFGASSQVSSDLAGIGLRFVVVLESGRSGASSVACARDNGSVRLGTGSGGVGCTF